jgi:hypothetical protein
VLLRLDIKQWKNLGNYSAAFFSGCIFNSWLYRISCQKNSYAFILAAGKEYDCKFRAGGRAGIIAVKLKQAAEGMIG